MMDLRKSYLLDKEFGFAAKYVNVDKRITYPSLPQLAFKRKEDGNACRRNACFICSVNAGERELYLLASVKSLQKKLDKWSHTLDHKEWLLSDYERAQAEQLPGLGGPSLVRHQDCKIILEMNGPSGLFHRAD
jgi:ATP-dependent helicase/nuclease subunit A